MKIKFKIILLILTTSLTVNAQLKEFSQDSLLVIFKKNDLNVANKKINEKILKGYNIDYKALYNVQEIKNYFLKLLDRKKCKQLEIEEYMLEFKKNNLDIEYFKYSLKSYLLEKKLKLKIDFILNSKKLTNIYKDSLLNNRRKYVMKDFNSNYKSCMPNIKTIVKFKYREVYDTLKKWGKENSSLDLFDELLKFNDPDAILIFDKKVENYVKSNGQDDIYLNTKKLNYESFIRECNTSYTFSKLTELIKIDKTNVFFYGHIINVNGNMESENSYINENYSILNRSNFFNYIKNYKLPYEKLIKFKENIKSGDISNEKKFMKENNREIIKAILDISKEMKKEEEYWMVNMPFYKRK